MTQPDKLTNYRKEIFHILTSTPFNIGSQQKYLWASDAEPMVDKIMDLLEHANKHTDSYEDVKRESAEYASHCKETNADLMERLKPTQNTVDEQHSGCPICGKPCEYVMSVFGSRMPKGCCLQEQQPKT